METHEILIVFIFSIIAAQGNVKIGVVIGVDDVSVHTSNITELVVAPKVSLADIRWTFAAKVEPFMTVRSVVHLQLTEPNVIIVTGVAPSMPHTNVSVPVVSFLSPFCQTISGLLPNCTVDDDCSHNKPSLVMSDYQFLPQSSWLRILGCPVANLLMAVVCQQGWSNAVILLQDSTRHEAALLIILLNGADVFSISYNMDDYKTDDQVKDKINDAYITQLNRGPNFIVICNASCMTRIISQAEQLSIDERRGNEFGHFSRWMFINVDTEEQIHWDLKSSHLTNVAFIIIPAVCLDTTYMSQQFITEVIKKTLKTRLKQETYNKWANLSSQLLKDAISLRSTDQENSKCMITLRTAVWAHDGRKAITAARVKFSGEELTINSDTYPSQFLGFNGKKLIVGTKEWEPFVHKRTVDGEVEYYGLCIEILIELSHVFNFTYELVEPPDGKWGTLENDSWTGLIGQLVRKEIDLAVSDLSIQVSREKVMDFVQTPYHYEHLMILIRRPDSNDAQWRTLLDPITPNALLCIGASVPVFALVLFLINRFSAPTPESNPSLNLGESLWYLLGALLMQGGASLDLSQAGRTVVSCWWLYCIVLVGLYSGKLISVLTVPINKLPFNNLEELVTQEDYKFGTAGGSFYFSYMQNTDIPVYKTLAETIDNFAKTDPSVLDIDYKNHIQKVLDEKYAYIGDETNILTAVAKNCNLLLLEEQFFRMNYGIALPNHSPYRHAFARQLLEFIEVGLVDNWTTKWRSVSPRSCNVDETYKGQPIKLLNIYGAFYVIGGLVSMSIVILLIEIIWSQRAKRTFTINR